MRLYLSKQCESLTGSLGRGYGYAVRKSKKGFYGYRYGHGTVPPDGHWRLIVACAQLANAKLHVTDIEVSEREMRAALDEAQLYGFGPVGTYNARRVLEAKQWFIDHKQN